MKLWLSNSPTYGGRLAHLLIGLTALFAAQGAVGQNVLEDISYTTGSGGSVQLVMQFSGSAPEPRIFTTTAPARIAMDFSGTTNGMPARSVAIGTGATRSVMAAESGGRTRVVVDLFRMAEYTTEVQGDRLIVDIGSGLASSTAAAPAAAAPSYQSTTGYGSGVSVRNVDFRRGPKGEGRIVVTFDGGTANTDLREEAGGRLVVNLYDVSIASSLEQRLDVVDFATPVQMVDLYAQGPNTRMVIEALGDYTQLAYQTENEYVVELSPAVEVAEEPDILIPDDFLAPKDYVGSRVTFTFQDIPVRSVLQLIADVSQLNIVVADSVQGNVTLRLQNVPWDQALDLILNSKALDKRENGNVIWIAPAEEIAARERQQLQALQEKQILEPLRSAYIQVNYAKAVDLAELIKEDEGTNAGGGAGAQGERRRGLLSNRGTVSVDERTNVLLIADTQDRIEEIRSLVQRLDRPVRQVQIESRIVIASEDFAKDLGVRFGITAAGEDNDGNVFSTSGSLSALDRMNNAVLNNRLVDGEGGSGFPNLLPSPLPGGIATAPLSERLNVNLPAANPAGTFGYTVLAADYLLDLELSALQTEGRGEIVSTPRLITANQNQATIKQGQEIPFVAQSGVAGGVIGNVQFKEAVLELTVTPLITPDDRVVLDLLVKKDEPVVNLLQPGGEPAIDRREIETQVLVNNGQTVVLGGIYEYTKREAQSGVPILQGIPGLGALFRQNLRENEKAELLIFVTPTILEDSGIQRR